MRRPLPRPLVVAQQVVVLFLLANLLTLPWAPAWDPDPLPFRNPLPAAWIERCPQGFFLTWLGQPVLPPRQGQPFRILMVGSSAMQGGGVSPFQSIPGRLQSLLDEQGRQVEVINAGVPGSDSGLQRRTVREGLEWLEPDLVVVYCGNNEYHRLRAYKEQHPLWTARTERLRSLLERTPLYRWLASRFRVVDQAATMEGVHIEELKSRITAQDRPLVEDFYRSNLVRMGEACQQSGVPLVLCAVAVNEMYPPEYGRPDRDPDLDSRLADARMQGTLERSMEEELRRHPELAWLHYQQGCRRSDAGRLVEAAVELGAAVGLDPEPSRATPAFVGLVRAAARTSGALFVDIPAALRQEHGPVLGDQLFLDFCHFLPEGNQSVARALLLSLDRARLLPAPGPSPAPVEQDPLALEVFSCYLARPDPRPARNRLPRPGSDLELRSRLPAEGTVAGETLRGHLEFVALRPAEAEARYRKALTLAPSRPALWRNLGYALLLGRSPKAALECWAAADLRTPSSSRGGPAWLRGLSTGSEP
ncbi:MAG: hypothetical protein GX934_01365 [Burkholderiales bacterium]|nr:hypothetical protein [Burkholderiales bacterium]